MYKEILLTITGIHVFPVISLVLFVIVFSCVLISVARMDKHRARRFAALPLDDAAGVRGDKEDAR